jgi:CBS domain-containing protein
VDTSAINYRVADFLKKHPPFHAVDEVDLLELASRGRVRFFEANEYILWQGEPHKSHVFVIQQGTVALWDESGEAAALRDVRGAGDMLGIERFGDAPCCLHSARSETDVVIYSFPSSDFYDRVLKYPYARQFVQAHDTVTADYQWAKDARDPQSIFLHDVVAGKPLESCGPGTSLRNVARTLLTTGADAIAVVDGEHRVEAVVTANSLLAWIAEGGGPADQAIGGILRGAPPSVGSAASVTDGMMALAGVDNPVLAMTSDGSSSGRLHALVTSRDMGRVFGDEPTRILNEIRLATTTRQLRALNHRARSFALQYLTSAASVDWLARVVSLTDVAIIKKLIARAGDETSPLCWCLCGTSGRGESITRHVPQIVAIVEHDGDRSRAQQTHDAVREALEECGYLPREETPFDRSFHVATKAEWQTRYRNWLTDPVRSEMYLARPLFDLRPVHGRESLWREVESTVVAAIDRDFLHVLANDCLATLPPLTFFQDAVVDKSGEQATVFQLEESALRPLVDVGRVFGMAARKVLGSSTRERFVFARTLLPEHEAIFREASETLRILLWQQARIGIRQDTTGSELPPALLSRHDRHVLKGGFRSILRLLQLTGNSWFANV